MLYNKCFIVIWKLLYPVIAMYIGNHYIKLWSFELQKVDKHLCLYYVEVNLKHISYDSKFNWEITGKHAPRT